MDKVDLIIEMVEKVVESQNVLNTRMDKVLDDHEDRIRASEKALLRLKSIGSMITALAGFFGWDTMKHHISILK